MHEKPFSDSEKHYIKSLLTQIKQTATKLDQLIIILEKNLEEKS